MVKTLGTHATGRVRVYGSIQEDEGGMLSHLPKKSDASLKECRLRHPRVPVVELKPTDPLELAIFQACPSCPLCGNDYQGAPGFWAKICACVPGKSQKPSVKFSDEEEKETPKQEQEQEEKEEQQRQWPERWDKLELQSLNNVHMVETLKQWRKKNLYPFVGATYIQCEPFFASRLGQEQVFRWQKEIAAWLKDHKNAPTEDDKDTLNLNEAWFVRSQIQKKTKKITKVFKQKRKELKQTTLGATMAAKKAAKHATRQLTCVTATMLQLKLSFEKKANTMNDTMLQGIDKAKQHMDVTLKKVQNHFGEMVYKNDKLEKNLTEKNTKLTNRLQMNEETVAQVNTKCTVLNARHDNAVYDIKQLSEETALIREKAIENNQTLACEIQQVDERLGQATKYVKREFKIVSASIIAQANDIKHNQTMSHGYFSLIEQLLERITVLEAQNNFLHSSKDSTIDEALDSILSEILSEACEILATGAFENKINNEYDLDMIDIENALD